MILIKQTFLLIQLYKDCIFVGFAYEDKEAEKIISNLMSKVSSESSLSIEIPDNPFYNLYFGLCCLERVLELIKEEYTKNINASIKHLEDAIYKSNDFQNLIEVSRNIGRKLINQDLQSDFSILKNHISEQLEYLERSKKHALPPQTLSIETQPNQVEDVKTNDKQSKNPFDNIEITNPNYGKGFIERNGKYYLQLVDGEVEHSLEDINNQITAHENMQEYHNVATTRYPKILELPIGKLPKEFNSIIQVDLFIDNLSKIYSEKVETFGIKNVIRQIKLMIDIEKENISNPLLKDTKEVNVYYKTRLDTLYNFWNEFKTTSATVENKNLLLKHREIALIYWYDRDCLIIDLKTSQQIAEDNGHKSKTSGLSLYNDHYTKVRDKAEERTDNARSEEYLNNIIPRLTTERGKREANEDLKTAKNIKENKKKGLFY